MGNFNPLTAEERTRLTRMKNKGRHAVAFYNPKKGKMSFYTEVQAAWDMSVKCNPENLPPPNALLATTDEAENDENEETDQNVPPSSQLVVHEDQQSPGSPGSAQTERISRSPAGEAVSPGEKLSSGKKLVKSVVKIANSVGQMRRDFQDMFRAQSARLDTEFSATAAERIAAGDERGFQKAERREAGAARAASILDLKQAIEDKEKKDYQKLKEKMDQMDKDRAARELAEKKEKQDTEDREETNSKLDAMNKDIGKAVELGTKNLELGTKIAETAETILGKIETAFDSSQQKVAADFVKCGLLSKFKEAEVTKAAEEAEEATPKKKAPAEEKPASPLQQMMRRGARRQPPAAAAAAVAPSSASRSAPRPAPRATPRKTRAGGGAPVAVASRAPAAAAVNIMSKASPSTAAQTFGLLMRTLLSLNHDEWSKKVDALHHGIFEHLERANNVGKVDAAFVRLLPSLLKVIKANEGQVVMAALTTVATLAAKYALHFKPTAAAILPALIERSADTGSVNIAEAAMRTAVCLVVNASSENMVSSIETLLDGGTMRQKPKACACMAVLLGQLSVRLDEPQFIGVQPLYGIIGDLLGRHLLEHSNEEVRRKAEAAVGLLATTNDGESAALNLVDHFQAEPIKEKLLKNAIKNAIKAKALEEATPVGDSE